MAHLMVKVTNTFGIFEGKVSLAANTDVVQATDTMRALINSVNELKMLSIENDGSATVFGEEVLKNSVITIRVQD
jgi:hypothetical protein